MVKTQYLIKKNVFKMIFRALWWALKEEACSTLGEIRYNNYTTFFIIKVQYLIKANTNPMMGSVRPTQFTCQWSDMISHMRSHIKS